MLEFPGALSDHASMETPGSNYAGAARCTAYSAATWVLLAVALAASMGSLTQSWNVRADTAVNRFDGIWIGEMRTTFSSGPCGQQYRIEMTVEAGAASGSASRPGERFTLYGNIGEDGMLEWNASSGRGSVSGAGPVQGESVHGDWEDSTGLCAGTFDIERAR